MDQSSTNNDHRRAYADTLTQLCSALIDGYQPELIAAQLTAEGIPDDHVDALVTGELDELRIRHAVGVQVRLQAAINAHAPLQNLTAGQQATLRGDRVSQPAIDTWTIEIPLVLSTHGYEPDGPLPRPEGNIIWIDPRDEATYLTSLHHPGIIRLAQAPPPVSAT